MKKTLLSLAVCASLAFGMEDKTNLEITEADVKEINQMAVPEKIEKQESMRSWFNKMTRKYKKPDNKIFTASVAVKGLDTDPQFALYVQNAFDRAFLEARAKQILDKAREVAVSELASNFSTNANDKIKEDALKEKASVGLTQQKAVASAELNYAREQMRAKLKNQGLQFDSIGSFLESAFKEVSDEEVNAALAKQGITNIANLSREEKMNIFKQNYAKEIFRKGSGEIVGLVPIQTYLRKKENSGSYELGLVAVVSPKTVQIATDLRKKQPTRMKGKCQSLGEQIPIDNLESVYQIIGPRLAYNENCEPVIVSYAQGNFIPSNDDIKNQSLSQIAEQQADVRADAYITNFIYSNVNTQTLDKTEEVDMTNAVLKAKATVNLDDGEAVNADEVDGALEEETIRDTINYFSSRIASTSKETLVGVETFGTWDTLDEPYEKYPRVVGVVKYYSTSQIAKTKDFYNKASKGVEPAVKKTSNTGAVSKKSFNSNTVDDF